MKRLAAGLFALALLAPGAAIAKPEKYIYDPAHTQIHFSVSHLGFSFPSGRFDDFTGGFVFDEKNPEKSAIDVTIRTHSIDMASEDWEKHLKGPDFFNADKFPIMTFHSRKIEKTGANTGKITGDFTLLGITKPITLDVVYNHSGTHPYSKNHIAGFSASGIIRRSDFGMTYGLPGVGDEVALNIQVEGIRQDFENVR